jgi:hypothetical protein
MKAYSHTIIAITGTVMADKDIFCHISGTIFIYIYIYFYNLMYKIFHHHPGSNF